MGNHWIADCGGSHLDVKSYPWKINNNLGLVAKYDSMHRLVEFRAEDHVFLKESLMKVIIYFGKVEKLWLRHVGSFPFLERLGVVEYKIVLL